MNRREFMKNMGAAAAGAAVAGSGVLENASQAQQNRSGSRRQEIRVGGRRVRTIDIHTHCYVRDVVPLIKDFDWGDTVKSAAAGTRGGRLTPDFLNAERIKWMDEKGTDVQIQSVNAFWYTADRATATKLIAVQNEALARDCAQFPDRLMAFATVALQFPDLAAKQLEEAMTKYKMPGVSVSGNVNGEELSSRRFDPFWAKVQELGAFVFIHPQAEGGGFEDGGTYPKAMYEKRFAGSGNLRNVLGHPFETTIAMTHLIFDGTLDRFPGLRICGAHGAGYLPAYISRSDATCEWTPKGCTVKLKKKPSEYFKEQLFCDTCLFDTAEVKFRVDRYGAGQVVMGTDHPASWPSRGVDLILETPGLTDDQKIAILGGNLSKLMKIPQF